MNGWMEERIDGTKKRQRTFGLVVGDRKIKENRIMIGRARIVDEKRRKL